MHILLISHDLSVTGAPNSLLRQAKYFQSQGHQVMVWSLRGGNLEQRYREAGFLPKVIQNDTNAIQKEFAKLVVKPDFILCNTVVTYKCVDVLQRYDIPVVWFIRETAVVRDMWQKCAAFKKVFAHFYNLYTVSEYAAQSIREFNPNVRVIHNAIEDDFESFSPLTDKVRFGFIGTIQHLKGIDVLIDAFAQLQKNIPHAELVIAGRNDRDFAQSLMKREASNPNVIWLGEVQGKQKRDFFDIIDVLCVPSLDEAFGLTILEGAMKGKALILTENCGAKFMVENGVNGFVVPILDVNAQADVMKQCCDLQKLAQMQQCSRQRYLQFGRIDAEKQAVLDMLAVNLHNLPVVQNEPLCDKHSWFYHFEGEKLVVSIGKFKLFSKKMGEFILESGVLTELC